MPPRSKKVVQDADVVHVKEKKKTERKKKEVEVVEESDELVVEKKQVVSKQKKKVVEVKQVEQPKVEESENDSEESENDHKKSEDEHEKSEDESDVEFDEPDNDDKESVKIVEPVKQYANSRAKVVDSSVKSYPRTNEEYKSNNEQKPYNRNYEQKTNRNDNSVLNFRFGDVVRQFDEVKLKDVSIEDMLRYLVAKTHFEGPSMRALCGVFKNALTGMKGETNLPLRTDQNMNVASHYQKPSHNRSQQQGGNKRVDYKSRHNNMNNNDYE